ncbi:MAG: NAD(P)-dependent oxidoreductase [Anaerolineales bacterium]|nr:MAG: NAD(P)-dependent oxidoreductase [Anaerolineales bacterium]
MIVSLICGRAENQPFPGRNTFPLLGRPLMVYPILAALNSFEVNKVYLSTDDANMSRIASHIGVGVIERSPELAAESVTLEDVIEHGYQEMRGQLNQEIEALVVLIANAPTVTAGLIDQGVEMLRARPKLDAVMSVSRHNEYHPHHSLQLTQDGLLRSYTGIMDKQTQDAYFPDSLLFVLRPQSFFGGSNKSARPNFIVNVAVQQVAALVHEGYGDVDYPWQIPMVEEWLRRRGFSETDTPYSLRVEKEIVVTQPPVVIKSTQDVKRRVLITTVPFGQADRYPLNLLESNQIEYVINPVGRRLKEEELVEMIPDFGVLIAGTEPITEKVIASAPNLGLIARVGIGLDNVHLLAARERGIQVTYTPDAPSPAVAELTIGQMLSLLRGLSMADRNMRNGVWHRFMGRRLSGITVGLIGVGRVGKLVARHLSGGFPGIRILGNDLSIDDEFGKTHNVQWVEKEHIYREADVISLHLPLTPITRRLITVREIEMMKRDALLVNTSRGNMIDEHDLAEALRAGRIAGASIDVFEREPYTGELSTLENCLLTSHMGSMSLDCRSRMEIEATEEAIRFLRKEPLKCLVPQSEYEIAASGKAP